MVLTTQDEANTSSNLIVFLIMLYIYVCLCACVFSFFLYVFTGLSIQLLEFAALPLST